MRWPESNRNRATKIVIKSNEDLVPGLLPCDTGLCGLLPKPLSPKCIECFSPCTYWEACAHSVLLNSSPKTNFRYLPGLNTVPQHMSSISCQCFDMLDAYMTRSEYFSYGFRILISAKPLPKYFISFRGNGSTVNTMKINK